METREHDDLLFRGHIHQAVGEATQDRPPRLTFDDLVLRRSTLYRCDGCFERSHEVRAQTLAAGLIPLDSLCDLSFGPGPEDNLPIHPSRDQRPARTSSQGVAAAGSRAWSSSRRSISSSWASVKPGMFSGDAPTLSQRSSASCIRSAGVSSSKSASKELGLFIIISQQIAKWRRVGSEGVIQSSVFECGNKVDKAIIPPPHPARRARPAAHRPTA